MRRPVTLLQKEDKRKAALSIIEDFIQSVKNEVDLRTQGNIKDFILGIIVKGTTRLKYGVDKAKDRVRIYIIFKRNTKGKENIL